MSRESQDDCQPSVSVGEMRQLGAPELSRLVDAVPALLWTCNGAGTDLFLNDQWVRYTGCSMRDLADPGNVPFHREDADWMPRWLESLAKGVAFTTPDFRLRRHDGMYRWFHARAVPITDAAGAVVRWYGVTQDIHDVRMIREALREQEERHLIALERRIQQRTGELAAANRELESFAHAVSHDLRAPLRAVSALCEALKEDCSHFLSLQGREYLRRIVRSNQQMGEIVEGLLTLSVNAHQDLRVEHVDLSALAIAVLEDLTASENWRSVSSHVQPGLHAHGDARLLEVVMRNLIGNAWKYTMHTEQAKIHVYAQIEEQRSWICVTDNGAGFDMAYATKLFQPFHRLHCQDQFQGMGLGLATVQRIVQRHGGCVTGHGEPGRGATFRFCLPPPESIARCVDVLGTAPQ